MDDVIAQLEALTRRVRGRMMTVEETERFDAAMDRLQKAFAPCRVEAQAEKKNALPGSGTLQHGR